MHTFSTLYTFGTRIYLIMITMIATMTNKDNSNKTYTLRAVPCEYLSFQERQRRRTTPSKDISSEDRSS